MNFRVPPYEIKTTFSVLSETIDWSLTLENVPEAWKTTKGENVRVAVLDTGVDGNHPDLLNAVKGGLNFTDDRSDFSDRNGHGTACSTIIGARKNDAGMIGVAPLCKVYHAKVLSDSGNGDLQWLTDAIHWCVDEGIHVVNMSLGTLTQESFSPLEKAVKKAVDNGLILVAAAGNESAPYVSLPARLDGVIAVGAIDQHKRKAAFSNTGANLDFVLPGVDVYAGLPRCLNKGLWGRLSGTSFACPIMSGICALILSKHLGPGEHRTPIRNVFDMIEHLKRLVVDLGTPGKDNQFGWGFIDLSKWQEVND